MKTTLKCSPLRDVESTKKFIEGLVKNVVSDALPPGFYKAAIVPMMLLRRLDVSYSPHKPTVQKYIKLVGDYKTIHRSTLDFYFIKNSKYNYYHAADVTFNQLVQLARAQDPSLLNSFRFWVEGFSTGVLRYLEEQQFLFLVEMLAAKQKLNDFVLAFSDDQAPYMAADPSLDNNFDDILREFNRSGIMNAFNQFSPEGSGSADNLLNKPLLISTFKFLKYVVDCFLSKVDLELPYHSVIVPFYIFRRLDDCQEHFLNEGRAYHIKNLKGLSLSKIIELHNSYGAGLKELLLAYVDGFDSEIISKVAFIQQVKTWITALDANGVLAPFVEAFACEDSPLAIAKPLELMPINSFHREAVQNGVYLFLQILEYENKRKEGAFPYIQKFERDQVEESLVYFERVCSKIFNGFIPSHEWVDLIAIMVILRRTQQALESGRAVGFTNDSKVSIDQVLYAACHRTRGFESLFFDYVCGFSDGIFNLGLQALNFSYWISLIIENNLLADFIKAIYDVDEAFHKESQPDRPLTLDDILLTSCDLVFRMVRFQDSPLELTHGLALILWSFGEWTLKQRKKQREQIQSTAPAMVPTVQTVADTAPTPSSRAESSIEENQIESKEESAVSSSEDVPGSTETPSTALPSQKTEEPPQTEESSEPPESDSAPVTDSQPCGDLDELKFINSGKPPDNFVDSESSTTPNGDGSFTSAGGSMFISADHLRSPPSGK